MDYTHNLAQEYAQFIVRGVSVDEYHTAGLEKLHDSPWSPVMNLQIVKVTQSFPGQSGIVYCLSRKDCEKVCTNCTRTMHLLLQVTCCAWQMRVELLQ